MCSREGNGWRCLGLSVAGSSHVAQGLPCQDSHAIRILDNGILIIAVADGAGSAARSGEGARLAVERSSSYLCESLQTPPGTSEGFEAVLEGAISSARTALEELAPGTELASIATTLLVTAVSESWLSTIQVGDGSVVARRLSGELQVLTKPNESEHINETTFLTSTDYQRSMHRVTIGAEDVDGVAMLTDGLQLLALSYHENTAFAPFFSPLFEFVSDPASVPTELEDFLRSERVCDRTDDDKTLVIAARHAAG